MRATELEDQLTKLRVEKPVSMFRNAAKMKSNKLLVSDMAIPASPMQDITRTFDRLGKVSSLLSTVDLQNILKGVVDSLSAQNIHVPSRKLFQQLKLDDMTMNFIMGYSGIDEGQEFIETEENGIILDKSKLKEISRQVNKEVLYTWDFSSWTWSDEDKANLVVLMFDIVGVLDKYKIAPDTLIAFVEALQHNYLNNPYHNFAHAFGINFQKY